MDFPFLNTVWYQYNSQEISTTKTGKVLLYKKGV